MDKEIAATFIIFGGSGDLAQRKLYPALFNLYKKGMLQDHFAVIGTARRPWTDEFYREIVVESVTEDQVNVKQVLNFASHFYYQSHDVTDTNHYVALKKLANELDEKYQTQGNRIFYMAMSPRYFGTIATHIHQENLLGDGFNRLIIEKPFGNDLVSATELNRQINDSFAEKDVYRIDHYLGKEMVQNILPLRFSNQILAGIWDADNIASVQVTLAEKLGVEERGGYYETAGALRDMVQNHIFQIITSLAIGEPKDLSDEKIHEKRQELLDSLIMPTANELENDFVRAQYLGTSNSLDYTKEEQVDSNSTNETFVAGKIKFGSGPLEKVPFYFRTGKRLAVKSSRVDVIFKQKDNLYQNSSANVLTIEIDPCNRLQITINGKNISDTALRKEKLTFKYSKEEAKQVSDAYERLIADVLHADRTHFTTWSELAPIWKFIDLIEDYFHQQKANGLVKYDSYSMGPVEADKIFENNNDHWILK